jgi:plastocyanin
MRRFPHLTTLLALLTCLTLSAASYAAGKKTPAPPARTYTVLVGMEYPQFGIGINAYFPGSVTIHVGDTVHWRQNSNEIHTVTFLAGTTAGALIIPATEAGAPSPLLFNPVAVNPAVPAGGLYDGTTYANSGLMGREEGQVQEFSLTFTQEGTHDYMCLVHGSMMSGRVEVVASGTTIPSPVQVIAEGWKQIAEKSTRVPAALREAEAQIEPPVKNPNGTLTHHVMIGYMQGQIALMQFFPDVLAVRPGDTVVWEMSPHNDMPHTVTFLNGEPEPSLVIPVPQPSGPPSLYANPALFFPSEPSPMLTRNGIYSSGVMDPIPGTTYTLTIGNIIFGSEHYLCLLHDTSGMTGTLIILP